MNSVDFAKYHWELSHQCQTPGARWAHRTFAFIHVGFFSSQLSVISEKAVEHLYSALFPTNHTSDACAIKKMEKNAQKAFREHVKKDPLIYLESRATGTIEPLQFNLEIAENIGPRYFMEDASFFKKIEGGAILGVFDGHGGKVVAEFACKMFQEKFNPPKSNLYDTFNHLIEEVHQEVVKKTYWSHVGSTAVLSYIDEKTGKIYTATLGDSEANIYRKTEAGVKSLPLSCVRDWGSKKDAKRASLALNNPSIATEWPNAGDPKNLRFEELNVSRAIGDASLSKAVIHKAKITINQLIPGDILILASDGLKDFVSEKEIAEQIDKNPPLLGQHLVDFALKMRFGADNVTVLVVKV